ncbi:type II secretion system protein [uncultured Mesotoga sp.]|uniref:prepilin-type N-terminal cleavage/methylation domain-containing protein n=1 Tax=Mesotoga sp. TaxID=2053577 RepID=UPI002591A048|nr:type II secretion system protein [uncultured Mesotoga sp.]
MKNRKRGFSLVELLIVLAVIAALIATITPVALNAIRKAQATKVAQNMKTLAAAIENAAYVNGVQDNKIYRDTTNPLDDSTDIVHLGRDIAADKYGIKYQFDGTEFRVMVFTNEDVDTSSALSVLSGLTSTNKDSYFSGTTDLYSLGLTDTTGAELFYYFEFDVY